VVSVVSSRLAIHRHQVGGPLGSLRIPVVKSPTKKTFSACGPSQKNGRDEGFVLQSTGQAPGEIRVIEHNLSFVLLFTFSIGLTSPKL